MYVTAHRVRDSQGNQAIHTFLRRHDRHDCPFPEDPVSVPQFAPGRLVRKNVTLTPGGNTVLSYLDLMAPEGAWSDAWRAPLVKLAARIDERESPLIAEIERLTVIFGATDEMRTADEYRQLLQAALSLLDTRDASP
jgi:hypothetical protein